MVKGERGVRVRVRVRGKVYHNVKVVSFNIVF